MSEEIDFRLKDCEKERARFGLPARHACLMCPLGPCPIQRMEIPDNTNALYAQQIESLEAEAERLRQQIKLLTSDWSKEAPKPVTRGQIILIPHGHCEFRGKSIRVESCVIARAGSNGLRHGPDFYSWSWRIGGRVVKKDGTDANDGRHYTHFFVRLDWKPEPTTKAKA